MIAPLDVTLPVSGDSSTSTARVAGGGASSFADQLATILGPFLSGSQNGSQFEVDVHSVMPGGQSFERKLMITVQDDTAASLAHGSQPAAAGSANTNSPTPASSPNASEGSGSDKAATATAPVFTPVAAASTTAPNASAIFAMFPNALVVSGELSGPPAVPVKAPPARPNPYIAPPPEIVYSQLPTGLIGVYTLESAMQSQLELVEREGAVQYMMNGVSGWDLPKLVNSFTERAQQLSQDTLFKSPKSSPDNWRDVAAQYQQKYLDWLGSTDAGHWDPKLSGPVYDRATGTLQTFSGPMQVSV